MPGQQEERNKEVANIEQLFLVFECHRREIECVLSKDGMLREAVLESLNKAVKAIHPKLVWEIGPGRSKEFFLAISPSGNNSLLSTTERVADSAPQWESWEVLSAKPPKADWGFKVDWGYGCSVDFREWRYGLLALEEYNLFDVEFIIPNELKVLDKAELNRIGFFLLSSIVGEINVMRKIDSLFFLGEESLLAYEPKKLEDFVDLAIRWIV